MVDNVPDAFDEGTIYRYHEVTDAAYNDAVASANPYSLGDFTPWVLSNPTSAIPFSTIVFHILTRRPRESHERLVLEALKPIHLDHPDLVHQLETNIYEFHYDWLDVENGDYTQANTLLELCAKATTGLISSCLWRHPRNQQTIPEPSRTVEKNDHPAAAA